MKRTRTLLMAGALFAAACSSTSPDPSGLVPRVDCRIAEGCGNVLAAANKLVPLGGANVVVFYGRGLGFHAEVHACSGNGSYVLVDVMGPNRNASVRDQAWQDPPCR